MGALQVNYLLVCHLLLLSVDKLEGSAFLNGPNVTSLDVNFDNEITIWENVQAECGVTYTKEETCIDSDCQSNQIKANGEVIDPNNCSYTCIETVQDLINCDSCSINKKAYLDIDGNSIKKSECLNHNCTNSLCKPPCATPLTLRYKVTCTATNPSSLSNFTSDTLYETFELKFIDDAKPLLTFDTLGRLDRNHAHTFHMS
ncbi:hypothetical protein DPMN_051073 [Dreissena polymorpha]|uniref:Uncharacterized protein n=1 Tax=Dreissena polymorpha TaxID=45954 RepID=A0A9D4CH88_DREPO|nr:hypothetical protein DPMN_051073 [Dreissena polymorpha]